MGVLTNRGYCLKPIYVPLRGEGRIPRSGDPEPRRVVHKWAHPRKVFIPTKDYPAINTC